VVPSSTGEACLGASLAHLPGTQERNGRELLQAPPEERREAALYLIFPPQQMSGPPHHLLVSGDAGVSWARVSLDGLEADRGLPVVDQTHPAHDSFRYNVSATSTLAFSASRMAGQVLTLRTSVFHE
jgi:hypothetical protein